MRKVFSITAEIISGIFILLFFYTAISKLMTYQSFRTVLSMSPAIGKYAHLLAWFLPSVELVTVALLFIPRTKSLGLTFSLALMLLFTGYIFYMLQSALHLPCSCGGVLKHMSWKQHLLFNTSFTVIAVLGLLLQQRSKNFIAINRSSRIPV